MKEYLVILIIIVLFLLFFNSVSALDDLGSSLGEILLVFHVSLDLSDSLLISRNLNLFIQIDFLSGLLPLEIQNTCLLQINFRLDSQPGEFLQYGNSIRIPCRAVECIELMNFISDFSKSRSLDTGNLYGVQVYIRD